MGRFKGIKRFGRRARRGLQRGKQIIGKAAASAKTILGRVDKATGGAATEALSKHVYGQKALEGLNTVDTAFNS